MITNELKKIIGADDAELEELVERILIEQAAEEKRAARLRMLIIVCMMALAWCCGAMCAVGSY